ncbi:putative bifunctional diguanylate cyclase/phosphodiesterase [Desulfovibrio piger]|nr:EAL domain-containing protein [Desulfovibrio piger]
MQDVITSRLALEKNLRKALERGEFVLHYQPKVDIRTGAVTGMEALVRWVRDDGTIVPPQDFIPVAEKTGLIVALGEFVLREACRQMHAWQKRFGRLKMAVNISARQFQPGLPDTVASALADAGLDPGLLELEITETTMMRDLALTVSVLERLTTGGIAVAIDDFGTGHSSLYYLKTFPISSIKIDRSFVRDIPNDETDATIVTTVVSMGRNLGIGIVAEGVETEAQLDFLRSLECPEVQGYYFSKPLPPHAFEAWMENRLRV